MPKVRMNIAEAFKRGLLKEGMTVRTNCYEEGIRPRPITVEITQIRSIGWEFRKQNGQYEYQAQENYFAWVEFEEETRRAGLFEEHVIQPVAFGLDPTSELVDDEEECIPKLTFCTECHELILKSQLHNKRCIFCNDPLPT